MQIDRVVENKPTHILLVEDDDVDVEAMLRAFHKHCISNPISVAKNGIEALALLRGHADAQQVTQPYIILLDMNMPQMNGVEFLTAIRQDIQLKQSIVFVLTTSNCDEDKIASYNQQVAGYLLKSRSRDDFSHVIDLLKTYGRIVEFPPELTN